MRRAVLAVLLLAACRIDLDHRKETDGGTSGAMCMTTAVQVCMDATTHSDLTSIQDNIFSKQCTFTGCHNGGNTDAGRLDLRNNAASLAHLVNFDSNLESGRKLVVAGDPKASYLSVMLGTIKPSEATPPAGPVNETVGLMPMDNNGSLLCCQKLDAIDRWIMAGAMNN